MNDKDEVKGLGGWLILVGIGVVLAPLRLVYDLGPLYYTIITNGTYEILTTPGTDLYHSLWAPLLIFEALSNSFILLASIYLVYLYFIKHYLFPKVYIALAIFTLFFIPLDAWLGSFILIDQPIFTPELTKKFIQVLVGVVIWVPYLLISKRVKATFVKHMTN